METTNKSVRDKKLPNLPPQTELAATLTQEEAKSLAETEGTKTAEQIFFALGIEDFVSIEEGVQLCLAKIAELQRQNDALTLELACIKEGILPECTADASLLVQPLLDGGMSLRDALSELLLKYPQLQASEAANTALPRYVPKGDPKKSDGVMDKILRNLQ